MIGTKRLVENRNDSFPARHTTPIGTARRRWRFRRGRLLGSARGPTTARRTSYTDTRRQTKGQRASGLIGASRIVAGSLSAARRQLLSEPRLPRVLQESTRRAYRSVIEPLRQKHGHRRVAHLETRHVEALMAEKAETPAAANNLRKRLRQLLKHAIKLGWIKDDPAASAEPYRLLERWLSHLDRRRNRPLPRGSPRRLFLRISP